MFVRNDSKAFRFCRPKCHKSFLKKRNPRKVRWTKAFRKANNKEMRVDSTFEFERRRNKPIKYNRELMGATIRAMKRISEIQTAREQRFQAKRMEAARAEERVARDVEIEKGINLIMPAAARRTEEVHEKATAKATQRAKRMEVDS